MTQLQLPFSFVASLVEGSNSMFSSSGFKSEVALASVCSICCIARGMLLDCLKTIDLTLFERPEEMQTEHFPQGLIVPMNLKLLSLLKFVLCTECYLPQVPPSKPSGWYWICRKSKRLCDFLF